MNFDKKKFEEAMRAEMINPIRDRWDEYDNWKIQNEMKTIVPGDFNAYDIGAFEEIFMWYEDELLMDILGMDYDENIEVTHWERHNRLLAEVEKVLRRELDDKKMKRLVAYTLLRLVALDDRQAKCFYINDLDSYFYENVDWYDDKDMSIVLIDYWADKWELLKEYSKEFDGMTVADMMKFVFEAEAMFYDNCEQGSFKAGEVLKALGYVKYGCGHMG